MRAPDTFVRMRKDGCRETVPPAASGLKDLCEVESAEMEYAGEVPEELEEQQDELYEHFAVTVDRGQAMLRIDKYLAVRLENCSRSRVQAAADSGNILVNGIPVKSSYKVKPLDRIALVMPYPKREVEIIPEDIPLDILYEDDDLIVLNKPAGLVVHPGHGNYSGTLVNALTWHLKDLPLFQEGDMRAGLVHRIDKNTSGLLVVAKNERAHARLARQFFDHTVSRRYVALVWGNFEEDEGTVTGNIGRSVRDRLRMAVYPDGSDGKHAVTHYRVLKRYGYVTLVECRLETGRTHQIRVHMEYIGHPLFNDERYGGDRILKGTTFAKYKQFIDNCFSVMPRHALHARSLGFEHPSTGGGRVAGRPRTSAGILAGGQGRPSSLPDVRLVPAVVWTQTVGAAVGCGTVFARFVAAGAYLPSCFRIMQFAMEERTFTIIKPNAVAMGVTGRIIDAFLQDGFRILAMRLVCMSRNDAEKFYAIHRGREFFSRLVDFMTSGPCVVMLLEREDAVAELRRLVGNTDPARAAEGTLRRMYGENVTRNAVHASDSVENARMEASRFFREEDIVVARYEPKEE